MNDVLRMLSQPWPWYVAGPLIGLTVPAVLLWVGRPRIPPGADCFRARRLLVGFGTRWAGGCTSGHAITGLANLQLASLIAVIGFFAGGLISTHWLLPLILAGLR